MARGKRRSSEPYLRGNIWWIRYTVPGETKERLESSKSTSRADAQILLTKRRREIDQRTIAPTPESAHYLTCTSQNGKTGKDTGTRKPTSDSTFGPHSER